MNIYICNLQIYNLLTNPKSANFGIITNFWDVKKGVNLAVA